MVQFKTLPPLDQLRPFSQAATIIISVTDSSGAPIEKGWVQIRLDAPKPGWFFSTDFPFVEGSHLLDMRLPLRRGRVQWQYLFPIRGQYLMTVEAVTAHDRKTDKTFRMAITENERKWMFLGLFTLGLFFFGFFAGRLFTSSKLVSKKNVALYLSLSSIGVIYWQAAGFAQEGKREQNAARLEINAPRVGELSRIRWSLAALTEGKRQVVNLSLRIIHLEKGKTVFALEKLPVAGELSLDFQFPDGDEYRVEAIADLNGQELIRSEETIAVNGIEPPASATIPAIVLFLAVISLGLWTGRWSRRATTSSLSA